MLKLNTGMWPSAAAAVLTDVSVHHLGTEFAHSLQVVDLPLEERYLGFQVLILGLVLKVWDKMRRWEKQTCQQPKGERGRGRERGGERGGGIKQLTISFFPMVLLWERERVMLKKDSFLVAENGGDEVLTSLPLEGGSGGEAVDWARPPERLSVLGEELTVLELWPATGRQRGRGGRQETEY